MLQGFYFLQLRGLESSILTPTTPRLFGLCFTHDDFLAADSFIVEGV